LIRLAEMARPRLGVTLIPAYLVVRFTLESGHVRCKGPCLLWANSGHGDSYPRYCQCSTLSVVKSYSEDGYDLIRAGIAGV
jgi:hypothetical protein